MNELAAIVSITCLAVISPGADFAMITRTSLMYGRVIGLLAALGIACGVLLHVSYALIGVSTLVHHAPLLLTALKWLGALYLLYLGLGIFRSAPVSSGGDAPAGSLSRWQAWRCGFFTNALNPKTTLFVVSTFAQVVQPTTPLAVQLGYGAFMSVAHLLWFALVTLLFSHPQLRQQVLNWQVCINQLIGSVLMGLGAMLALSPLSH
ncbi:LysE family transporter [Pokkaliibacter sp. MBI-7]|uniref:LysE family translocator n=1 Tax=Pokkaliibacter sp. MBI-7 TaxID=3040600 RepID=UPI002447F243|nr:LysE family transporter [Pokkaliibacter sp. MBI-7]MDH2434621.1 LysE family transporter [Pokkaliibacter sp. MBI-7]